MRQLEGAWYDGPRIERSKVRVQRLGYFEDVNIETPPVAGHPRPGRHRGRRSPRRTPATCSRASATRAPRASCCRARSRSRTSSAPATRSRSTSTPARSTSTYSLTYTEPYWTHGRRRRARSSSTTRTSTRPASRSRSTRRRPRRGDRLRRPDHRDRHRSTSASASSTRSSTLFADSPPVYFDFVSEFGYATNSVHRHQRLVARHARRHPVSRRAAGCRASFVEIGLPLGDLTYYKLQYVTSRSTGRSTATSC